MTLYHGSNMAVVRPDLNFSRKNLDFGAGFYTTENKVQAVDFARKVMIRKGEKNQKVSVYDFVHHSRRGTYVGALPDLVIGPVANDDVFATLIVFEQGILNVEQTLEALKVRELYNQFVFKTDKALSFLRYIDSFEPIAEQLYDS